MDIIIANIKSLSLFAYEDIRGKLSGNSWMLGLLFEASCGHYYIISAKRLVFSHDWDANNLGPY